MTQAPRISAPAVTPNREEIAKLGRSGRPWEFLPLAGAALAISPQDHGLRFLAAANLARLGLKTLSQEMLDLLPHAVSHHPDVATVQAALSGLPNDALTVAMRERVLVRNLQALGGMWVDRDLAGWRLAARGQDVYKCLDGNVLRRDSGSPRGELRVLAWLQNARERVREAVEGLEIKGRRPLVVEGVDPPWMLMELWARTSGAEEDFSPRLLVVQRDVPDFVNGLSLVNLTEVLADPRVECVVGDDGGAKFRECLSRDPGLALPGTVVASPGAVRRLEPECAALVREAVGAREAEYRALGSRLAERYRERTLRWWRDRYARAGVEDGALRVLVPASRHTTYVKHAVASLVRGFQSLGCEARVLTEPTPHDSLSPAAYLREVEAFDPDLMVLTNHTRLALGEFMPPNLPLICWVQDASTQVFSAPDAARQGMYDFTAGYMFPELLQQAGFRPERALPLAAAADARTFFEDSPPGSAFTCDLLAVTHQSETPDAMHERLVAAAPNKATALLYELLRADCLNVIRHVARTPPERTLTGLVGDRLSQVFGRGIAASARTLALRGYALPMADRMLRHETLEWAAEIASGRGWSFHLHGRGWDRHPTLSAFARGPLEHGEPLRRAYAGARINLHATIHALVHARTIECAHSGGVTLVRYHGEALDNAEETAFRAVAGRGPGMSEQGRVGYDIADHPELMGLARLKTLLGNPPTEGTWWFSSRAEATLRGALPCAAPELDAHRTLGDLAECAFASATGLERFLERAIDHPSWRAAASRMQKRGTAFLTHEVLAAKMVEHVRRGLSVPEGV